MPPSKDKKDNKDGTSTKKQRPKEYKVYCKKGQPMLLSRSSAWRIKKLMSSAGETSRDNKGRSQSATTADQSTSSINDLLAANNVNASHHMEVETGIVFEEREKASATPVYHMSPCTGDSQASTNASSSSAHSSQAVNLAVAPGEMDQSVLPVEISTFSRMSVCPCGSGAHFLNKRGINSDDPDFVCGESNDSFNIELNEGHNYLCRVKDKRDSPSFHQALEDRQCYQKTSSGSGEAVDPHFQSERFEVREEPAVSVQCVGSFPESSNIVDASMCIDEVNECHNHSFVQSPSTSQNYECMSDGCQENISELLRQQPLGCTVVAPGTDEVNAHRMSSDDQKNNPSISNPKPNQPLSSGNQTAASLNHNDKEGSVDSDCFAEARWMDACAALNIPKAHLVQMLLLLSYRSRYNLSYEAGEAAFRMGQAAFGDTDSDATAQFSGSKYYQKKIIKALSPEVTLHHVCPACRGYIGPLVANASCRCCRSEINKKQNKAAGNIIVYTSIQKQLEDLLCFHGNDLVDVSTRVKNNPQALEDIYDGHMYREMVGDSGDVVSFNFNIDGVPVFDSGSKNSLWPVLLTVNELPLHLRRKNVLIVSLWLGHDKPRMDSYLKPFLDECDYLFANGITYISKNMKITKGVQPLVCICDSVARHKVQHSKSYRGKFGCGFCLHPGKEVPRKRGHTRVYTMQEGEFNLRTHDKNMSDGMEAEATGTAVNGIKGRTCLKNAAPNYDTAVCVDPEWMHAVALGVVRQVSGLWYETENSKTLLGYYLIAEERRILNSRLASLKPSDDMARMPRTLEQSADWKAHEWTHFLLHSSIPVLKGLLSSRHLKHWSRLVLAISVLLGSSITLEQIEIARIELNNFVEETISLNLYEEEHVGNNFHLLTHLADSVQNWGPLWAHSACVYEDYMRFIKEAVHSAIDAPNQVIMSFFLRTVIPKLTAVCHDVMSPRQIEFVECMMGRSMESFIPSLRDHNILIPPSMVGKGVQYKITNDHYRAICLARVPVRKDTVAVYYDRASVNGKEIQSLEYKRMDLRNNSVVALNDGRIFITSIFVVVNGTHMLALGRFMSLLDRKLVNERDLPHLICVRKRRQTFIHAVKITEIDRRVMFFECAHLDYNVICFPTTGKEFLF